MLKIYLLLCSLVLIISPVLNAQNQPDKTIAEFISKIDSIYTDDFLLKNGRLYTPEYPRAQGDPFFLTDKWSIGEIVLKNTQYKDKKILFDIYNERLICAIDGVAKEEFAIKLNNDLVTSFKIENHQFINSNNNEALPQNGYYEIIYSGYEISAFFKWKKKYLRIYTNEYQGEFDKPQKKMILVINGKSISINKTNDLMKLFVNNKKQIKTYLHDYQIKLFKSDNDALSKMFKYCEELDKQIVEN